LEDYKAVYEKEAARIESAYQARLDEALLGYGESLGAIKEQYKKAGDLTGILRLRTEQGRFRKEKSVPDKALPDLPPLIQKAQSLYRQSVSKAKTKKTNDVKLLAGNYLRRLVSLRKELVSQDKLDEAIAVDSEVKRAEFILALAEAGTSSVEPGERPRAATGSEHRGELPAALTEGLVLYYDFDKDEGGKVTDLSGKGNDGKVNGAKWTKDGVGARRTARGWVGGACEFDGQDDYIDASAFDPAREIGTGKSWTMSLWYYQNPDESKQGLIGHMGRFYIITEGSYRYRVGWGNHYTPTFSLRTSPVKRWTHFVAVCNAEVNRIDVHQDGCNVLSHGYKGNKSFNHDRLTLGRMQGRWFLNGMLDEVMIWNRALSQAEVKQLYKFQGGK